MTNLPNNLPAQISSFVGRERAMADVRQLLRSSRLVTLIGTGGCGKTRLALQVGAQLCMPANLSGTGAIPCEDGVWFVEFAGLADPALAAAQVAATLGVHEMPGQPLLATLKNYLHDKPLLLILDNCEHLIDACSRLVYALLRACPSLRLLATSREALNTEGEHVYRVSSLATPGQADTLSLDTIEQYESLRLFVERAAAAQTGFALSVENITAVRHICQRLDGIPLAIELAAARVKTLSVEQIAARLESSINLLEGGTRTGPVRHQTLRAALDWSHELLPEKDRVLFRRLSVFAADWTLEAVEQVCALNGSLPLRRTDIFEALMDLVNKSLATVTMRAEVTRYRLLEPIRQYAMAKLDEAGETPDFRERHLDFFMRFAEEAEPQLHRAEQIGWMKRLETERKNMSAALDWARAGGSVFKGLRVAGALGWFWFIAADWSSGYEHTVRLLAALEPSAAALNAAELAVLAKTEAHAGWLAQLRGDEARAEVLLSNSVAHARQPGSHGKSTLALGLSSLAYVTRDLALAQARAEEAVAQAREAGEDWFLARAQNVLGRVSVLRGELQTARALFESSLKLWRSMGDNVMVTRALGGLVMVFGALHDYAAARDCVDEEIALIRATGARGHLPAALENMAHIAMAQGQYTEAEQARVELLAFQRAAGNQSGEADALHGLGEVARAQNDAVRATAYFAESLRLEQARGDDVDVARCLLALAALMLDREQPECAVYLLSHAESLALMARFPRDAALLKEYQHQLESLRKMLPKAVFAETWQRGRTMRLDQLLADVAQAAQLAPPVAYPAGMTEREVEVLRLVARGWTNQEIADHLVVSRRTVHAHLRSIFSKLDVTTRGAAARYAAEYKLT